MAGLLLVLLTQVLAVSFTLVFTLISNRGSSSIIPEREYATFVDRVELIWSATNERRYITVRR